MGRTPCRLFVASNLCLLSVLLQTCTFSDGSGWANVRALVVAGLVMDDTSRTDTGQILTDQGFLVRVDTLSLTVDGVAIVTPMARDNTGASPDNPFDPAHPPTGYTLCHGGHCHTADGGLESYDEIEEKLSSGEVEMTDAVHTVLDMQGALAITAASPTLEARGELGAVQVTAVAPLVSGLTVTGTVEIDEIEVPLEVTLGLDRDEAARVRAEAAFDVGPDGPGAVQVEIDIQIPSALFDGVRYSNLAVEDGMIPVDVDHPANEAAMEAFLAKLATLEATATVEEF